MVSTIIISISEYTNFFLVQLGEYLIEKGTVIITDMTNIQRNPEFYPDMPESFFPERYMNNLKSMQAAVNGKFEERDHFAFGWGRYSLILYM